MKKGNGKASGSKKPRRKKADKPRKMSVEQLSDMDRQRLLLAHKRKLKPLLLTEAAAKKAVTQQYELAKKEGITKKELKLAFMLDSEEGAAQVKLELQQILNVDRWIGSDVGSQLELFNKPNAMEKAFEDGKRSALSDEPARPPSSLSQNVAQEWLAGHAAGLKSLNEARAEGFKPLGATVREVIGDQHDSIRDAA